MIVRISCVSVTVARGMGVKISGNFADVIQVWSLGKERGSELGISQKNLEYFAPSALHSALDFTQS